MKRWLAYQVDGQGSRCVGEVWAMDACDAYARALFELRCRIDYVAPGD